MTDLNTLTLADARDLLLRGEITSVALTEACLGAIAGAGALNAFVHNTPDLAMARAKAADARIARGDAPAMCGLPIGIKDLFCTEGVPSQAASGILDGFRPEYESTVSAKLRDAGAVMLGKLNMDEFAMGSSNETSVYGHAVNPWKVDGRDLTPGGSPRELMPDELRSRAVIRSIGSRHRATEASSLRRIRPARPSR